MEVASQYLNTTLRGDEAHVLAQQLFTVLDRRLPAKLFELSDSPEGSLATYKPDEDLVGTISSAQGAVSILVERVPGGRTGHIWLLSSETLKKIPDLFNELDQIRIDRLLPKYLSDRRIAGVALFNYLGVFLVMPALYLVLSLLNRILGLLVAKSGHALRSQILSPPVRLLLIVFFIYEVLSELRPSPGSTATLATIAEVVTILAFVWLMFRFSRKLEYFVRRHLASRGRMRAIAVVRLGVRLIDLIAILASLLIVLYVLGFNPTTTLAGLGIGGVAIALASKTTLENVLGGISLISDGVISVGDEIKFGDTVGSVEVWPAVHQGPHQGPDRGQCSQTGTWPI